MKGLLRSVRLSLELLLGRRLVLFAVLDAVVLLYCLLGMLLANGDPQGLYQSVVLVPILLLGVPSLAGLVDVERRAGCLDLALSAPSAEGYFVRRAAAVCAALSLQGSGVMLLGWIYEQGSFPILPVLVHIPVVSGFLGAVALFWAVRVRTAGGVWLATLVTVGLLHRWFFANPVPDRHGARYGAFLAGPLESLEWLRGLAALAGGALLFFLYARRRLRRPETMLS